MNLFLSPFKGWLSSKIKQLAFMRVKEGFPRGKFVPKKSSSENLK